MQWEYISSKFLTVLQQAECKDWVFNSYGDFVRKNMSRLEGVPAGDGVTLINELFKEPRKGLYRGKVIIVFCCILKFFADLFCLLA